MNCKNIQKLLLTDYPDGELEGRLKKKVEEHLRECFTCRQLEHTLRKTAIEPFKKAIRMKPGDSVWNRIRESIVFKKRRQLDSIFDKLQNCFRRICFMPRAAFILTTGIIALLIVIVMVIKLQPNNQKVAIMQPKVEIDYVTDLMGEAEYFSIDDNGGYNTAIEEYFL